MKKFLLGAVCALTVSSTSFAQLYGNDKGNGGDAVMINNEMVMRDFVSRSNLTPIPDSVTFIKSVPDLQALIAEISRVNSGFALALIAELSGAQFYNSSASLDILPSATTAIGGPRAEVQLAVRWGNDIVLAPEFKNLNEKSYLLIHEALHGIRDAGGALHHERVRMVVNYLKTNRGHYTTEAMLDVLKRTELGGPADFDSQVAFDKTVPVPLRCTAIGRNYLSVVARFMNLDCERWRYQYQVVQDYIPTQIDFSYLGSYKDYYTSYARYSRRSFDVANLISLPQTGLFARAEVQSQKSVCWSNNYDLNAEKQYEKELALVSRVQQDFVKFFKRTDISANTKQVVRNYFTEDGVDLLDQGIKNLQADLAKYAKNKATRIENEKRCIAKFGSAAP